MSENSKAKTPMAGLKMLTGGLITTGSLGWALFRIFKYPRIDYKELIMHVVSVTGGLYILWSANVFDYPKSTGSQEKSITSEKDALNVTVPVCEASALSTLFDRVNEWDQIFAHEAGKSQVLDKKISRNNKQEVDEVNAKYEDLTKKLNDLNKQGKRNELLYLPTDTQMKIFYYEGLGSSKTKFREEIISLINELKGYVQGTIDPLPLAKNIQFLSTDMSDEKRREIALIVKEYANSMLPKIEKTIDEFVYSVCTAGKILNDKEHKVKNALETLGVSEKDFSPAPIKTEMSQYYNALEKATKNKSQMPSCQNGPRSTNVTGASTKPLESASSHNLQEIIWTKTSEPRSPMMPKLETPTGVSIPFKPRGVNKPSHLAVKKIKSPHMKPPSKLVLSEEQMKFFNILKSELEDARLL